MSILVVWSSPNTDGLTAAAKNKVIKGILAAGKEAGENFARIHDTWKQR